jgi:predicted transcriptional regulator
MRGVEWDAAQLLRVIDEHPNSTPERLALLLDRSLEGVCQGLGELERYGLVSAWDEHYLVIARMTC